MHKIDPIFIAPRFVKGEWGRSDLGAWLDRGCCGAASVTEAWICDPSNRTEAGSLGDRLARLTAPMLGDLGRAPPRLRLVFPGQDTTLESTSPVSFWTILEPACRPPPGTQHRAGDRIRAYEGAGLTLAGGSVALEVSASFQPANQPADGPAVIRLPPVSARTRATLFREAALSVERWLLPPWSRLVPDGETCHVFLALTPGVRVDDRFLAPGEAVFVPALGRAIDIAAHGRAAALVAYPDTRPTSIWRHIPGPDPEPTLLTDVLSGRSPGEGEGLRPTHNHRA